MQRSFFKKLLYRTIYKVGYFVGKVEAAATVLRRRR